VKVLDIDEVLGRQEAILKKGVKASRIFPSLLDSCELVSQRYLMLKRLKEFGVREIVVDPKLEWADHPYPPELLEAMRVAGITWFPPVKRDRERKRAYLRIFRTNFSRDYYAVIPYREWPRLIGEPDLDLGGIKAYSVKEFIGYLDGVEDYCRSVYSWLCPDQDVLKAVFKSLREARSHADESKYVIPLDRTPRLDCLGKYDAVLDEELRSKGIRVLMALKLAPQLDWAEKVDGRRLFYVIQEDLAKDEIEKAKLREAERAERERLRKQMWEEIVEKGRIGKRLVRVSLRDLEPFLRITLAKDLFDRLIEILRELCDPEEIYLQKWSFFSLYSNAGLSIYHPLRHLYLVKKFRDRGLGKATIFRQVKRVEGLPSMLVFSGVGFYALDEYWEILVKPRRGLKIEYPCEARWEDGSIVIVDRTALREALRA